MDESDTTDTQTVQTLNRHNFIAGLHELADFLDAHPSVPVPSYIIKMHIFVETKEELAAIARQATWSKEYRDTWFSLCQAFGHGVVSFEVNIEREKVCRRVEWKCDDALLVGGSDGQ